MEVNWCHIEYMEAVTLTKRLRLKQHHKVVAIVTLHQEAIVENLVLGFPGHPAGPIWRVYFGK